MKSHRNLTTFFLGLLCFTGFSAIALSTFTSLPVAIAQSSGRNMEIRRVLGNVTFRGSFTRAKSGDRLTRIGQGLSTGSRSSAVLALDEGIGFVNVAAQSSFVIDQFETTSNGGKVTVIDVKKGQVKVQTRSFTNPQSRLEVRTPAGIAGVRGTEFGVAVADDGQTNVLTDEGAVAVEGNGETVRVPAGYGSIVVEGEAPTEPAPFTENLDLEIDRARHSSSSGFWEVAGRVDPFNFVWINDQQVNVQRDGSFQVNYEQLPKEIIAIRILSPLGSTKTTYLFLREEAFPIQLRGDEDEFAF